MAELRNIKHQPMASDTEPTDEELSMVMQEARDIAMARKRESDEWMRRQLAQAVAEAEAEARRRDVALQI